MTSECQMDLRWRLLLEPRDSALVLKALGGRLKPEEVADAKALGDKITKDRASAAAAFAREMQKHSNNIGEHNES